MMQFEKDYFESNRYTLKERVIKRHVFEVLKWASTVVGENLLKGAGKTALDIGCACGYTSTALEKLGYETCSIDVSKWGLQQAKKITHGNLLICDAQTQLPFKKRTFDIVTCFDVLEHLKYPEKAFQQMLATCCGTLVCTTPNRTMDKPIRKITRDYDETHINTRYAADWKRSLMNASQAKLIKVDTFLDLSAKLTDKRFFFKSLRLPKFGLTVRIAVGVSHADFQNFS
jgi:2-polyprenyl-3-methyl-5-hydroxy-6-metoxy-1,4-benzoquinol methylase